MHARSREFLEKALAERQASGIAFLFRRADAIETELYLGRHARPDMPALDREVAADSLFDLASLTKILATTSLLFAAESEGRFAWTDPVRKYFSDFPSSEVTVLALLQHRSGLPAHIEFFRRFAPLNADGVRLGDQKPLLSWIYEAGLPNAGQEVYSDLGFMLLGLLLESLYGKTLPELFYERIVSRLKLENAGYVTLPHAAAQARLFGLLAPKNRFVATELCPWRKKVLQGEVHDDNTWALGGYAGHAGLFANARDTLALFDHLRKQLQASPDYRNAQPAGVFSYGLMAYPGLRPFPGPAFAGARGHTGFTGNSLWYHEPSQTVSILLSNRVHPSRSDDRWVQTRLEFHKLLWEESGL
jgi:CubicO group peptidase (beta-lactamase class C family)